MISSRFTGPLVREIDALLLAKTNKVEVEFKVVEVMLVCQVGFV